MPKEIFKDLKKVWVAGQQLRISRLDEDRSPARKPRQHPGNPKKKRKKEEPKSKRKPKKKKRTE